MNFFKNVHTQTNLPSPKRENMINNMNLGNLGIRPRPKILEQQPQPQTKTLGLCYIFN